MQTYRLSTFNPIINIKTPTNKIWLKFPELNRVQILGKIITLSKSMLMKYLLLVRMFRYCGVKQIVTKRVTIIQMVTECLSVRFFPFSQNGEPGKSTVFCLPWAYSSVFVTE